MLNTDIPSMKKYYEQLLKTVIGERIFLFDNEDMYSIYININDCQPIFILELQNLCDQIMEKAYKEFRIEENDTAKLYIKLISLEKIKAMKCNLLGDLI